MASAWMAWFAMQANRVTFADWSIRSLKRGFVEVSTAWSTYRGIQNASLLFGSLEVLHLFIHSFMITIALTVPKKHQKNTQSQIDGNAAAVDVEVPWPTQRHWLPSKSKWPSQHISYLVFGLGIWWGRRGRVEPVVVQWCISFRKRSAWIWVWWSNSSQSIIRTALK